jgi:segregation and condensation protein B
MSMAGAAQRRVLGDWLMASAESRAYEEEGSEEQGAAIETRPEELRLIEALLFAASEPLDEKSLAKHLPAGVDVRASLKRLQIEYAARGVNLIHVGNKWAFRTANDLAWLMTHETVEPKKLSRAAVETLAIIAYHQPAGSARAAAARRRGGRSLTEQPRSSCLILGWRRSATCQGSTISRD